MTEKFNFIVAIYRFLATAFSSRQVIIQEARREASIEAVRAMKGDCVYKIAKFTDAKNDIKNKIKDGGINTLDLATYNGILEGISFAQLLEKKNLAELISAEVRSAVDIDRMSDQEVREFSIKLSKFIDSI